MDYDLAIISGGGGPKCLAAGGACYELFNNFKISKPSIVMTLSGSNVFAPNLMIEDYENMTNIAENYIVGKRTFSNFLKSFKDRKFDLSNLISSFENLFLKRDIISPFRFWKVIDIGMVVDILREQNLFSDENLNKIFASSTNYIFPSFDIDNGDIKYFSNRDEFFLRNKSDFLDSSLRAGMNLPGTKLYPFWSSVNVGGYNCCDTILTSSPQIHLEKIVELNKEKNLGIKKILMIDHDFPKNNIFDRERKYFDAWLLLQKKEVRFKYHEIEERAKDYFKNIFPDVGILTYTLKFDNLPIGTLDDDKKSLMQTLEIGRKMVREDKGLHEFLKS